MNRFVHEQNLRHLREVLARTTDKAKCRRIAELIEQEEQEATERAVPGPGKSVIDDTPPTVSIGDMR